MAEEIETSLHCPPERPAPPGSAEPAAAQMTLEAALTTLDGRFRASIINLSCEGAMIATPVPPTRGTRVVLKWGPLDEFGQVVWVRTNQCLVEFDEAMSEDRFIEFRRLAHEAAIKTQSDIGPSGLPDLARRREKSVPVHEWAGSTN